MPEPDPPESCSHLAREEGPDRDPIEAVFAVMESPLLSYAWRWTHDRTQAEDLVQEAFMRLHRQFSAVKEPRRWLFRTVHHLALNLARDSAKIVPFEAPNRSEESGWGGQDAVADPGPLPDEALAQWEKKRRIRLLVDSLEARSRELVKLKFEDGLSYQAMAERTGLTSGHVGYLLHHALKSLGEKVRQEGITP